MRPVQPVILPSDFDEPTIAAWIVNYAARPESMDMWLASFTRQVEDAASEGAKIFVLPEYISEAWLVFGPQDKIMPSSKKWQAEQAEIFFDACATLAQKHDMLIVAGTILLPHGDGSWRNRAVSFLPDGTRAIQDKLCLMPDEMMIEGLTRGTTLNVFSWNGLKVAVVICLDTQIPAHAAALVAQQPDLVIVPSMTLRLTGHNRVTTCAAARAVELHCPVVTVGGVGSYEERGVLETNVSGANVFQPCEMTLGTDGSMAAIGPMTETDQEDGLLLIAHDVPVYTCRAARARDAGEAWRLFNHTKPVSVATVAAGAVAA